MDVTEELQQLDNVDLAVAQRFVQCLTTTLNSNRDPELLSDLIDYHLSKSSKSALRVLVTLKDIHSQDFFAKLHDCLLKSHTRLKSLLLLANMLNGEASWLYKTVDSPVFLSLLQFLRASDDIVLLSSTLYILCALIPLAPFHVSKHLPDLFEGFTRTATLKSTLIKLPRELFLGLDIAVYYFFLQLYALYPCKFLQYLKARFGPTGEVQTYNEHIAPLFRFVLLHPNLITDTPSHETQRTRWSSKEPHDIATLALSLCTDPTQNESPHNNTTSFKTPLPMQPFSELPCDPSYCGRVENVNNIWSPLVMLGDVSPATSLSNPASSRTNLHTPSNINTGMSTPSSELSLQTTPLPPLTTEERTFSYSPTASMEGHEMPPPLDLSYKGSSSSSRGVSPGSSGRTSPVRSIGNTPRSFRHVVSNIFRKSSNTVDTNIEEFTNILPSEVDMIKSPLPPASSASRLSPEPSRLSPGLHKLSPEPQGLNLELPPRQSPDPVGLTPDPLLSPDNGIKSFASSLPNTKGRSLLQVDTHVSAQSCPNETVLMEAKKRLNMLRDQGRPYSNSVLTESVNTLTDLTSIEEDETSSSLMLVQKAVEPSTDMRKRRGSSIVGVVSAPVSPVTALDQYIQNGNILHEGRVKDIPLADLTGADWDHYRGCPHTEELKIKTSLAMMLHSQVLFERYQCQQHAKRNRRLMSKARTTTKLESEVLALRCRLLQQDELITNLQLDHQNSKDSTQANKTLLSQNKSLHQCNTELKEEIQQLKDMIKKLKKRNKELTVQIQVSTSVEIENETLRTKLKEVPHLQNQMDVLLREQLVIEELYHQQKMAVTALKRENTELQQIKHMNRALAAEKKAYSSTVNSLKLEVFSLAGTIKEKDSLIEKKSKEISGLLKTMEEKQHDCNKKIQCAEEKFTCIKAANQSLEQRILELEASAVLENRK